MMNDKLLQASSVTDLTTGPLVERYKSLADIERRLQGDYQVQDRNCPVVPTSVPAYEGTRQCPLRGETCIA